MICLSILEDVMSNPDPISTSPALEVAKAEVTLDDFLKRHPTTITRPALEALVTKLRSQRAAWQAKQKAKGKDE